mmetsp:Transcript_12182/g.23743  ORF Transcript_12182/g.23743 Transcript_12182/m.23743 type:complete len:84 (-) Transcript_12182:327-578(-)
MHYRRVWIRKPYESLGGLTHQYHAHYGLLSHFQSPQSPGAKQNKSARSQMKDMRYSKACGKMSKQIIKSNECPEIDEMNYNNI